MGLTHVAVRLRNSDSEESYTADFLVDTGATDSMAPASALRRIGIKPTGQRTYEMATGELRNYEVGWAEFSFMDEVIQSRVIFGPDDVEPLLGVFALEIAGIVVDPVNQTLKKLRALSLKRVA